MGNKLGNIKPKVANQQAVMAQILKLLEEINYGSIEIVIHDGKVTLIERKEKIKPLNDY